MSAKAATGDAPTRKQGRERARVNPEFEGIGREFVQTHYRRRSIQLEQKHAANRVAFLQKEHDTTQRRLEQKQADLDRLMAVIGRKQADEERRQQLRQEREAAIALQRQQNLQRRHEHQERLRNAYLSMYDEHRDASDSMRRTFDNHENLRQSMKLSELDAKKEKVYSVKMDKEEGQKRVDSFFKARNDSFTEDYKLKISRERQAANEASADIHNLSEIQGSLKLKLETSATKLTEVAGRYEETYRVHANRSAFSVNSRSYCLKDSRTRETKDENAHDPDPKLQRMIEKELSFATAIVDV